tara:strand:- start:664 stop:1098 length:435 start_codon:yes stop_codon:yes gene_type:complete
MAILSTTDASVDLVMSSDPDVDVELPQVSVPALDGGEPELVDAPPRWCKVAEIRALGGECRVGATVVSVRPLNGAEYCRIQALYRHQDGKVRDYTEAMLETLRAGVVNVSHYDGGKDGLVSTLRWDLVDGLVSLIWRASQGYEI